MRLLFVLEPVIFRGDPTAVSAHFHWCECFRRSVAEAGGSFALASNPDVCQAWKELPDVAAAGALCYEIDPFAVLSHAGYERQQYARLALDGAAKPNPMWLSLGHIREAFQPDVVVMTAQNAMVSQAFEGATLLSVEQPPLPRRGQPLRTSIDPCGHQVGSILERAATRIKALPLDGEARDGAHRLLQAVRRSVASGHAQGRAAQEALQNFRREGPIALLVTQPKDAVTYEGAYHGIELENLVYAWAEALPPGWIGVPTYHAGERLSPQIEVALSRASDRLRFLPHAFAQSRTEPLLALADGVVTISSSSAMTALLMRRKVVVVGRSPFSTWCSNEIGRLDEAVPLTEDEAVSTFAFLTHRYSHEHAALMRHPRALADIIRSMRSAADPMEWFLDTSGYDVNAAATLFNLDDVDAEHELPRAMHRLRSELAATEGERNSLKSEWLAAVSQRDEALATLSRLRLEHDSVSQQWGLAVSERDCLLEAGRAAKEREERLLGDIAEWNAECRSLTRQLLSAGYRCDALAADVASARLEASQRLNNFALLSAQLDELSNRTGLLQAERDRLDRQSSAAQAELAASLAQRDQLAQRAMQLAAERGALEREVSAAADAHDRLARAQRDAVELLRDQLRNACAENSELHIAREGTRELQDLMDASSRETKEARCLWMAMVNHSGKLSRHLIEAMAERDSAQQARAAAVEECTLLLRRYEDTQAEVQSLRDEVQELQALPDEIVAPCEDLQPQVVRSLPRRMIRRLRKLLLIARGQPDAPLPIDSNSNRDPHD